MRTNYILDSEYRNNYIQSLREKDKRLDYEIFNNLNTCTHEHNEENELILLERFKKILKVQDEHKERMTRISNLEKEIHTLKEQN